MLRKKICCVRVSVVAARSFSIQKPSFSEDVVRPFLKKTIRSVEETWAFGASTIRKTLLETLMEDSTKKMKPEQLQSEKKTSVDPPLAPPPIAVHPILGKCVYNLGYKSIYVANIKSLVNANVWEKQRTLRSARAELIANSKIIADTVHYIPGIIALYHNKNTSEIGIFDGQHRVAALYILAQKNKWDLNEYNILIEVYDIEEAAKNDNDTKNNIGGMGMVRQLFKEINCAEPVSLIDIEAVDDFEVESSTCEDSAFPSSSTITVEETPSPVEGTPSSSTITVEETPSPVEETPSSSTITTASVEETPSVEKTVLNPLKPHEIKTIIDHVCQSLQQLYTPMFKPSRRCLMPHVNIDKLRDDIYEQKEHLFDHSIENPIRNPHDLMFKIDQFNENMSMKTESELSEMCYGSSKTTTTKLKVIKKAKQHQFYLGLDPKWMHK